MDWYMHALTIFLLVLFGVGWVYAIASKPKTVSKPEYTDDPDLSDFLTDRNIRVMSTKHPALIVRVLALKLTETRNRFRALLDSSVSSETARIEEQERLLAAVAATWVDLSLPEGQRSAFIQQLTTNFKEMSIEP